MHTGFVFRIGRKYQVSRRNVSCMVMNELKMCVGWIETEVSLTNNDNHVQNYKAHFIINNLPRY